MSGEGTGRGGNRVLQALGGPGGSFPSRTAPHSVLSPPARLHGPSGWSSGQGLVSHKLRGVGGGQGVNGLELLMGETGWGLWGATAGRHSQPSGGGQFKGKGG